MGEEDSAVCIRERQLRLVAGSCHFRFDGSEDIEAVRLQANGQLFRDVVI
jgi:hypothetical protein